MASVFVLGAAFAMQPLAIVTGGTRGIGLGISEALVERGFDLLVSYSADAASAARAADVLRRGREGGCVVELVAGDLASEETRERLFARFDERFAPTHALRVVVHNAGQYVGITSQNSFDLASAPFAFGDASLVARGERTDLSQMGYYQRLYGDAYVDLCEQSLVRMRGRGSLVGISSPGCTTSYNPSPGYDMPGSGKCVMEYAMRLYALRCAPRGINVNVVVPGVTRTDAWTRLERRRGLDEGSLVDAMAQRLAPMGPTTPRQIGDVVAFLASDEGRVVTGTSLPADGGVHLRC